MIDFLVIGGGIAGAVGRRAAGGAGRGDGARGRGRAGLPHLGPVGGAVRGKLRRAGGDRAEPRQPRRRCGTAAICRPRGLLLVGTRDNAALFETDMAEMGLRAAGPRRDAGAGADPEPRGGDPRRVPRTTAWDIDTDRLLQDYARAIRAAGGTVVTGSAGDRDPADRGRLGGRDRRRHARGAGAGQRRRVLGRPGGGGWPGCAPLGLQPYRRSMARIPAPGGHATGRLADALRRRRDAGTPSPTPGR